MENPLEQRLTFNRIFRHLIFYQSQKFTGKITVSNHQGNAWSFYFLLGHLTWATGGSYPLRRWRRQYYAATGQLPQLDHVDWNAEAWDCTELRVLTESNALNGEQVQGIVHGVVEEVLFDVIQAFEAPIYKALNYPKSVLPLSNLTGIGDGMELEVQEEVKPDRYYRLPYSFFPELKALQEKIDQPWRKWLTIGLACVSPNQAPLLLDPEALRNQVSAKVYRNMVKGLQGQTSLRDLAFKFKKEGNFFSLAAAMAPFYEMQLITFNQIRDLSVNTNGTGTKPGHSTLTATASEESPQDPLFLAIDSSRKNQSLLSAIAEREGYAFEAMSNGINALQKITQNPLGLPKIIFASYEMAVLKPTEFCTILRRLELPQNVPIVIYSKQSLPNREAREILEAGANELINRHSLTPSYVNSLLKKYQKLNKRQQRQTIDQKTYSQSKLTFKQRDFSMTMS